MADLAAAQGKFAAFVAIILQRAGVAEVGEFADLLDVFAETVVETDPEQGRLLADWAARGTLRPPPPGAGFTQYTLVKSSA
ncbi:MAG: hypothetical protein ABI376_08610 [Caulobacteraceae bacterium]